jgi:hypothetical protein
VFCAFFPIIFSIQISEKMLLIRIILAYVLSVFCFLLKIYTKCGRRAMPTMMTGSAATFVDCDECWTLLLVTRKGSLYLWDLFNRTCLLQDSLTSLVASSPNSSTKDAGTIYYLHRFDIACTWFSTKWS